jgi:hypothetical protein
VNVQVSDAAQLTEATGWAAQWSPASMVIYARAPEHEQEHDCGVDAATACCPLINFFTTGAHAHAWAAAHPVADGVLLTQVKAMRYALASLGGLLDRLGEVPRLESAGRRPGAAELYLKWPPPLPTRRELPSDEEAVRGVSQERSRRRT